jgi:hypothetical protein
MADTATPTTPATPVPGSPEADAAAAAKFDAAGGAAKLVDQNGNVTTPVAAPAAAPAPTEPAPTLIGGKFKSQEDLLAAYKALESKLGAPAPATPTAAPAAPATPAPDGKPVTPTDTKLPTDPPKPNAAVDFEAFGQEFATAGKLSDESYAKLAEKGYDRSVVDTFIAGQQAIASKFDNDVYALAGGEDQYGQMVDWATANLSKEQKVAFNEAMDSRDMGRIGLAMQGLKAAHVDAVGQAGKLLGGAPGVTNEGYRSRYEMVQATKDPRYSKDPAFRKDHEAKILAAMRAGNTDI